jgi:hypothetical protein
VGNELSGDFSRGRSHNFQINNEIDKKECGSLPVHNPVSNTPGFFHTLYSPWIRAFGVPAPGTASTYAAGFPGRSPKIEDSIPEK